MGLLKIIKKIKLREKEMRILMLGLDNAGKTTVVKQLCGEDVTSISPTLGFNIKNLEHMGYKLNIWDVGGQKTIRSFWRNYFENTDGLVWVVDGADVGRLQDCANELTKLLGEERLAGASLLILVNKHDLPGTLDTENVIKALSLERIQTRAWKVYRCSALTGEGLLKAFDWLVEEISGRIALGNVAEHT